MSPVSKRDVTISSMLSIDMDLVILVGAVACSLVLGLVMAAVAYYCLVTKKSRKVRSSTRTMVSTMDISNSYIHYGSPGDSVKPVRKSKKNSSQRKPSEYSVYSQNSNASMSSIMDKFRNSFREDSLPYMELNQKVDDKLVSEAVLSTGGKKPNVSLALNTCQNLSSELSSLGLTGSSVLGPPTLQITASTSLCEQCLSPPPSPPTLLGTSVSLPPTTVEMTKTALGMTNPASNHPVVCDTCLSPSKLGDTTRSLNLPYIGIAGGSDLRQRKMSPSGIVTNPRMKNPMLTTLRETMSNDLLDTLVNINLEEKLEISERREVEENSFDSLLSPSKACDWLSSDPFELSSSSDKSLDDPRMVKIQPKIKVKSSRHYSDASKMKEDGKFLSNPLSCSDDPASCLLSPPARNQAVHPVLLSNFSPLSSGCSAGPKGTSSQSLRSQEQSSPVTPLSFPKQVPLTPLANQKLSSQVVKQAKTPLQYQKHSSMTLSLVQNQTPMTPPIHSPFIINQFFPIVPPPSPFQTPLHSSHDPISSIVSIKNSKSSRTSVTMTPDNPPAYFQFPPAPGTPVATSLGFQESSNVAAIIRKQSSSSVTSTPILNPTTPVANPKVTPIKDIEFSPDISHQESAPSESPQLENPSHLAWDSTFEALKTLECSMKLVVTPLHKKVIEPYEDTDSPQDSNDSQTSACPGDKSCVSSMSLAWDNTGELLADPTSPESLNSSMQSLDIDAILGRVAPELLQGKSSSDPMVTPMPKLNSILTTPGSAHFAVFETSSPFLKKSVTSIDMDALLDNDEDDDDTDTSVTSCETPNLPALPTGKAVARLRNESIESASQLYPFNSPCPLTQAKVFVYPPSTCDTATTPTQLGTTSSSVSHLYPTSITMTRGDSSLLSTMTSLPCSPTSCVTEDYLSACGSMDSYSTAFEL